ncbi:MAG: hypothetical protein Q9191_007557 [Dirinaria sp. TL-2023a]
MGTQNESQPPIDLSHHYSKITKNRQASYVKDFYKYFTIPHVRLPNNNYFPFDTLEGAAALNNRFEPTPNKPVDPPSDLLAHTSLSDQPFPSSTVVVPKDSHEDNVLRQIDIKSALQYGTSQGYPPLYAFLRQFSIENVHPNVPYKDGPEIILTCGNTDGFAKTLDALTNEWVEGRDSITEKEGLLVEEFAYMNAIQAARPRGLNIVPVKLDDEGMTASGKGGLADVLANWDYAKGQRPHLIYTVTIGQNPTSGTLSVTRRKEIYALCVRYDIIIIEDDPYWYLQFPSANPASFSSAKHDPSPPARPQKSSGYAFLDSLIPSYLSVDTQGRVVRLDTFSKTVAPGCRLGWITTQPALCERLLRITETSTQQPSGFVQSMIAQLIIGPSTQDGKGGGKDSQGWHTDGWVRWLEGLRGNYERRMQTMCQILQEGSSVITVKSSNKTDVSLHASNGSNEEEEEEWSLVTTQRMFSFTAPLGGILARKTRARALGPPHDGEIPGPGRARPAVCADGRDQGPRELDVFPDLLRGRRRRGGGGDEPPLRGRV